MAKKYSADRFIKLSHEITFCSWDARTCKWTVYVKDLATNKTIEDTCDVLISARGNLNTPRWPEIPGFKSFEGEVMHSAAWNEEYDFENKRVGVVGTGSSAIQIVPGLQRISGTRVSNFARSRTWISPSFGQQLWDKHGFEGFEIPQDLKKKFEEEEGFYEKFRLAVEEDGNAIHGVTIKGTKIQIEAKEMFEKHMRERLKEHPEIFEKLVPDFSPGCRRLTPGPGYLEALTKENVEFVTSAITKVTEKGVVTEDGRTHELDALVCATGFHVSTAPPFPVLGSNGKSLKEKWSERPVTYLSHSIAGFPNMWTMLGPNAAIGSGSLTMMIESVGDYIVKAIRKVQKENIASMTVKEARETDFTGYVDKYFKGTVFGEGCSSWYKKEMDGAKVVTGLWPGSSLHCRETLRSPRWEDFEYTYGEENQLAWLGNGWSVNEMEGRHLAWYLYPEFLDQPVGPRPEEKEEYKMRTFSH